MKTPRGHEEEFNPNHNAEGIEYFADAADDPRLEKLIKKSDFSQTSFRAHVSSQHEIYPDILHNGELVDKGEHLELVASATVTGAFIRDEDLESTAIEFVSTVDPRNWMRVESNDLEGYTISFSDKEIEDKDIPLRELAAITLRANDSFPVEYLDTVEDDPRSDPLLEQMVKTVWSRSGHLSGHVNEANAVTKVVFDSENSRFIHHHLEHTRHIDVEKPETLDMHYQKVIPYPELGSEEVYHLSLKYIDQGHSMQIGARKIIRSREEDEDGKRYVLKSARITHTESDGTVRELDTKDPSVMKIFVDSYKELLDLA